MVKKLTILFVLLVFVQNIYAQDTITLSAKDYEDVSEIYPGKKHGWYFKQGVDSTWQEFGKGWRKLRPVDINASMTDSKRIFEGWFRAFIHFDSSFSKQQLSIFLGTRAAQDIFIDGVLYVSSGNTGLNGRVYKENEGIYNYSQAIELPNIKAGSTHLFLWHIKDTVAAPFSSQYLKSELLGGIHNLFEIVSPKFVAWQKSRAPYITGISILGNGIVFILFILFLLLWLLNRSDKNLLRFTIFCGVYFFSLGVSNFEHSIFYPTNISYLEEKLFDFIGNTLVVFFISYAPYLLSKLENHRLASLTKWTVPISLVASTVGFFKTIDSNNNLFFLLIVILNLLLSLYFVIELYRTGKKLNRIIVTGVVGSLFFMSFLPLMTPVYGYKLFFLFLFLSSVSFPISLMIYTAVRFKLILSEVRVNAETIVALSEEKRIYAEQQQHLLEEEVNRQTIELKKSLSDLQSAQSQLIQSEKMASLGELTAGIAHEIQNPLNFVNNFSEVSNELIDEMKAELDKGEVEEAKAIAADIQQNLSKIAHHGKRADSIVKGMLQHTRTSTGQKEPTDINALCDEYLRLSYHGLRAKDKSFNAAFESEFDESIGILQIVPQEIGRVLLNLLNNAFYAVNEKSRKGISDYTPKVLVKTKGIGQRVEITIEDNGMGIPDSIKEKIFQPFFTTKPTGQGTGLGLSLSYDIVKAHGGELLVQSQIGQGTSFFIQIPIN